MSELHTDVERVVVRVDGETILDRYRAAGGIDVIVEPESDDATR